MTQPESSSDPAASEQVGSIAEETAKLLHAWSTQSHATSGEASKHTCSTSWCPVCQLVGLVRDNPVAVARVTESAAQLGRSLRDLVETALNPREEP